MDGNQAKTRSIFDEWLTDLNSGRNETTSCNEATETEPDPGMMQSLEEHQERYRDRLSAMASAIQTGVFLDFQSLSSKFSIYPFSS
jgi:hypothetical protein